MLRATALAVTTAAILSAAPVGAQTIDLGGRGGPSIDLRSERQRQRDIDREEARREREMDRRRERRAMERDADRGGRCRTVTVRERDDFGRMVTRRTEECR